MNFVPNNLTINNYITALSKLHGLPEAYTYWSALNPYQYLDITVEFTTTGNAALDAFFADLRTVGVCAVVYHLTDKEFNVFKVANQWVEDYALNDFGIKLIRSEFPKIQPYIQDPNKVDWSENGEGMSVIEWNRAIDLAHHFGELSPWMTYAEAKLLAETLKAFEISHFHFSPH